MQRLAYLDAMTVDAYVPRLQLPGAGVSELCVKPADDALVAVLAVAEPLAIIPPTAAETAATPAAGKAHAAATHALFDDHSNTRVAHIAPVAPLSAVDSKPLAKDTPQFSLSIVHASNILIIDSGLEGHINPQEYLYALGAGKQQLSLDAFVWPLVKNGQVDQSERAARETLESFLEKQIEQMSKRYVLVMGEVACRYITRDELPAGKFVKHAQLDAQLIRTQSASQMLTEPKIKRDVWLDLKPLHRVLKSV